MVPGFVPGFVPEPFSSGPPDHAPGFLRTSLDGESPVVRWAATPPTGGQARAPGRQAVPWGKHMGVSENRLKP